MDKPNGAWPASFDQLGQSLRSRTGKIVEDNNLGAKRQERLNKMRADEPGATRHAHRGATVDAGEPLAMLD